MESPMVSAQAQLDLLAADREALRERAAYPFWYWLTWSLACHWIGVIAVVPQTYWLWVGPIQWLLFVVLFVAYYRKRVRVPRPPFTWPTRNEWLVMLPLMALHGYLMYTAVVHDARWLISLVAVVSAVSLAVFAHRTQRVVFQDER